MICINLQDRALVAAHVRRREYRREIHRRSAKKREPRVRAQIKSLWEHGAVLADTHEPPEWFEHEHELPREVRDVVERAPPGWAVEEGSQVLNPDLWSENDERSLMVLGCMDGGAPRETTAWTLSYSRQAVIPESVPLLRRWRERPLRPAPRRNTAKPFVPTPVARR